MGAPGEKYFKGRIYQNGKMCPYVGWDGVCNYESSPPPRLIVAEQLHGRLGVVQLGKKPSRMRSTRKLIEFLVEVPYTSIIWARDHAIYQAIVDEMTAPPCVWMQ
jgi:hypothetical protein